MFQVTPTAHFCMGGVKVDSHGETAVTGLFAAGEVTAGAHGANRLGGNALAEAIAMGSLVGSAAAAAAGRPLLKLGLTPQPKKSNNALKAYSKPLVQIQGTLSGISRRSCGSMLVLSETGSRWSALWSASQTGKTWLG
jgi:aspartate oxidase